MTITSHTEAAHLTARLSRLTADLDAARRTAALTAWRALADAVARGAQGADAAEAVERDARVASAHAAAEHTAAAVHNAAAELGRVAVLEVGPPRSLPSSPKGLDGDTPAGVWAEIAALPEGDAAALYVALRERRARLYALAVARPCHGLGASGAAHAAEERAAATFEHAATELRAHLLSRRSAGLGLHVEGCSLCQRVVRELV